MLPQYYFEYDTEQDRCLLLIKGVSGDLDHWVLGDSFMRTLYLVFDAENYQIGVMTNALSLGWDHEDLLSINRPRIFISNKALIWTLLISTSALIFIALCYRLTKTLHRRLSLRRLKERAEELARSSELATQGLESSKPGSRRRRSAELHKSSIEMIQYNLEKQEPPPHIPSQQTSEDPLS